MGAAWGQAGGGGGGSGGSSAVEGALLEEVLAAALVAPQAWGLAQVRDLRRPLTRRAAFRPLRATPVTQLPPRRAQPPPGRILRERLNRAVPRARKDRPRSGAPAIPQAEPAADASMGRRRPVRRCKATRKSGLRIPRIPGSIERSRVSAKDAERDQDAGFSSVQSRSSSL
jgi:hypothetical protein